MAWPGLPELGVVSVCARDIAAPQIKVTETKKTTRKTRRRSWILKGASLASNLCSGGAERQYPRLADYFWQIGEK
jgi:hypothetical protein